MSIYVNEVVYVLLVLGAFIFVAIGLSEIITFLATRFYGWFTKQLLPNSLIIRLQRIIGFAWHAYTEYLAELVFFAFALGFLIEKLANIPDITFITLVRTMNDIPWLWIAVVVSGVLWILAKRSRQKWLDKERTSLEDKLDSGFKGVNKNLNTLIDEIRQDRDERNKM